MKTHKDSNCLGDSGRFKTAGAILAQPAKTWPERRSHIDAALAIGERENDDAEIDRLEQEAKIKFGSYRE